MGESGCRLEHRDGGRERRRQRWREGRRKGKRQKEAKVVEVLFRFHIWTGLRQIPHPHPPPQEGPGCVTLGLCLSPRDLFLLPRVLQFRTWIQGD